MKLKSNAKITFLERQLTCCPFPAFALGLPVFAALVALIEASFNRSAAVLFAFADPTAFPTTQEAPETPAMTSAPFMSFEVAPHQCLFGAVVIDPRTLSSRNCPVATAVATILVEVLLSLSEGMFAFHSLLKTVMFDAPVDELRSRE